MDNGTNENSAGVGTAPKYRCFISYSQSDQTIAQRVQSFIERYRFPAGVKFDYVMTNSPLDKRNRLVFRDSTDLRSSSKISEVLQQAMSESACMVVLCSPSSARSDWVGDEIEYFRSLGRGAFIFPAVIAGDAHSIDSEMYCVPPALRSKDRLGEPFYTDLRGGSAAFKLGCLRLLAGMYGLSLDSLVQRHNRRRRRNLIALCTTTLICLLIASAFVMRSIAGTLVDTNLTAGQIAQSAGKFRLAEQLLAKIPAWALRVAPTSSSTSARALDAQLGYRAGEVDFPPMPFNMPLSLLQSLQFSNDAKYLAVPETYVSSNGTKDWISVFDTGSGRRISTHKFRPSSDTGGFSLNSSGNDILWSDGGQLHFTDVINGNELSSVKFDAASSNHFFLATDKNRAISFSDDGGPLIVRDASSAAIVGRVQFASSDASAKIAMGDPDRSVQHMAVLSKSGKLAFIDLNSGETTHVSLPNGVRATDKITISAANDATTIIDSIGRLLLFKGGKPEPVRIVTLPLSTSHGAVALNDDRFAAISEDNEVVFFGSGSSDEISRIAVPGNPSALLRSGDDRAVYVTFDEGPPAVVVDGSDTIQHLAAGEMRVSAFSASEAAQLYAFGTEQGNVLVGEPATGIVVYQSRLSGDGIAGLQISSDGRGLHIFGRSGKHRLLELVPPKVERTWMVPNFNTLNYGDINFDAATDDDCRDIKLSPQQNLLALRTTRGLDVFTTGGRLQSRLVFAEKQGSVLFDFDPSGQWILYANGSEVLAVVNTQTGDKVVWPAFPKPLTSWIGRHDFCAQGFEGAPVHWTGPAALRLDDEEETFGLVAKANDGGKPPTLEVVSRIGHDPVTQFDLLGEEHDVNASAVDRRLEYKLLEYPRLSRLSDGTEIRRLKNFDKFADVVGFNADGTRFLLAAAISQRDESAEADGGFALFDSINGDIIREVREYIPNVRRIEFSPDGRFLLANRTGGDDADFDGAGTETELIDAESGKTILEMTEDFGFSTLKSSVGGYADHAFARDGRTLYAVRQSGRVDVWDLGPLIDQSIARHR